MKTIYHPRGMLWDHRAEKAYDILPGRGEKREARRRVRLAYCSEAVGSPCNIAPDRLEHPFIYAYQVARVKKNNVRRRLRSLFELRN